MPIFPLARLRLLTHRVFDLNGHISSWQHDKSKRSEWMDSIFLVNSLHSNVRIPWELPMIKYLIILPNAIGKTNKRVGKNYYFVCVIFTNSMIAFKQLVNCFNAITTEYHDMIFRFMNFKWLSRLKSFPTNGISFMCKCLIGQLTLELTIWLM